MSARNWSTTDANASFTSITPMSSHVSPAFASAFAQASGFPCSIRCGSTPAIPKARNRARGSSPSCDAFFSDATSTAAEPSTIWLEFPAVVLPSGTNAGWSSASFSIVVPRRTASSTAKRVRVIVAAPPPSSGTGTSSSTGMISLSNRPSSIARAARMCDSYE